MRQRVFQLCAAASLLIGSVLASSGLAETKVFFRSFTGHDAGVAAAHRADADKQWATRMQLDTIDQMKWYSGLPVGGFGGGLYRDPPSLDDVYASGVYASGFYATRRFGALGVHATRFSRGYWNVFEPWPYVPGDIFGYQWYKPVRQPIGRVQIQTGPARWESHPVYSGKLPDHLKAPETRFVTDGRDELPPAEEVSPKRSSTGPREF